MRCPGGSLSVCRPRLLAQIVRGGALPAPLPLLPPDNWWNVDISAAPVDPNSTNFINFIGASVGLHPDFGGDSRTIRRPRSTAWSTSPCPGTQPLEPVTWIDVLEPERRRRARPAGRLSDPGRGADPGASGSRAAMPGNDDPGGDRHMLIVDRDNRILYELYHTCLERRPRTAGRRARAPSSRSTRNDRRPETWTSADAAGLAILPGLVRYDEAFGTAPIKHAFRMTVDFTNGYVFPASHDASTSEQRQRPAPGGAPAAQGEQEHLAATRPRSSDLPGHEDLRPDRGRQRLGHVHHRRLRHALEQRRAEPRLRDLKASTSR